ncbi:Arc family DNA-binding protein [Agrobacterium vitis]|uniref:Arc family DNA-binding protein n=1 Tax=Agrobacterium vitis TaxID=373 RepID=A0AAE5AXY8_AGRVI|nr:Arc family DNA-binding protein [Agrobacterium vitis]MCF1501211.1 Arc family DNA-binding protein [Allorhizobium sp. Av2]MCM2440571.1 Arc family DNA-binding protein [Agrobacterium vitis]MUZ59557.1 Arc family DNA-binding protein [Agrobacterium vitis]MVA66681.1 Arc family DNA-binding protein [Agrobacterium vitis]MVA87544.1 Arc family DNA-binding protein [Agrobacterium vitis]
MERDVDTATQFKLNIPTDVKAWIAKEATKNMRSQTAEIVLALKEKMKRQAETQKADATA